MNDQTPLTESENLRQQAQLAFDEQRFEDVVSLLGQAAQADPNNFLVHLDLVKMYLHTGNVEQGKDLFHKLPEEAQTCAEANPLKLMLTCAEILTEAPSLEDLKERLQNNPNDPEMLYRFTGYLLLNHAYAEAFNTLLKLFSVQRDFKDGIAQKTLLTLFDALQTDYAEMVNFYRRKLQGLLF